jgi:tyrosinase
VPPITTTVPSGGATPQSVATRQRRDVSSLLPRQLADLREAFGKVQGLSDDRGYQFHAGVHGLPLPKYCKIAHGRPLFLPWHRAYLYVFELALIRQVPTASLAWWDWTRVRKIPKAYDDANQPDGTKNPLKSVRINDLALAQGARDPKDEEAHWLAQFPDTFRQPGAPHAPPLPSAARVKDAIENLGDFLDFQDEVEQMHNDVHVWVGGHMGDIPFAAYDPIFWAHHSTVDRIWRLWQLKHPNAPMPFIDTALPPFSLTVRQTLDVIPLGYDYAVTTTHDPGRP